MTTLTKEQIQKLSGDQQEAVAEIELRLARKRQQLLVSVHSSPGVFVVPLVLALTGFCVFIFRPDSRETLAFSVFALFSLIQFHATTMDRRLNAVLDLLDMDGTRHLPSLPKDIDPAGAK